MIPSHFIQEIKTKGYDVIVVNVFLRKLMRFQPQKDNSVHPILLPQDFNLPMLNELFLNISTLLWILPSRLAALPHFPPCGTICAPFARSPSFPLPESSCNPLWVYLSKLKCMEGGQYAVNEMQLINDYNIKYNGFVPCV